MKKLYSFLLTLTAFLCLGTGNAWAQTVVLSENFDTADFDSKWEKRSCKSSSARYQHGSTSAHSGNFDFKFDYNSNPPQYLISKTELSIPDGATVYVSFYHKAASNSWEESFQLGYSTTNNETASFTWATEVKTKATSWTEYATDVLPAGTKYIAIRYTANNKYNLFIDDIVVSYEAASSCAKPTNLSPSNLEAESVKLSWTKGGTESAWNVLYKAGSAEWATIENVTDNPYTLSVEPTTSYQVKVQAVCGVGDESPASNTISFTTPCVATTLPIENDFSSALSPCWTLVDCHSETTVTGGAFKFRYNTTPPQYLITPGFVASAKELQVEFDYKVASSYNPESFAVGYSTTTNAVSAFTWGTEQTGLTNTSYTNYSETLPVGVKYVAIKYTANDKYALFIDNLKIKEVSSCHNLATLSDASAITSSGATFSWTTEGTENRFQYACVASGVTPSSWTLLDEDVFSHTVTGCAPETTYDFYVRAYCDESEQSDYLKKSFTTTCSAVSLPLENDFSSALSSCWTRVACEANSKVDGGKFQFVYNTNPPQYLITPEFNSAGKAVSVEFKYWIASTSYPESFQLGYSTTTNEVSSFTYEAEVTATNTSALTYTTTLPAEAKFVSIKYNSNDMSRLYIDDLSINAISSCAAPSSLSAASVASSGATLSWTKGSTESAWVVEYSTSSTFASDKHEVNAATNSNFELTGLSASTKYYVHVKAVCGVGDESSYSDAINFTTACPAQALPLEEDFSGSISCWTQVACTSGTGVSSGAFKFQYNTTPPQYLISPELETSAKGLQVEFDYKVQTSMFEESFAVGYSTTTNAVSAFTWGTEQTGLINTSYTNYSEIVPAGVKYVAIKYTANDKSALYIDNVSISVAPTCFKPATLSAASSITPDGATFTWAVSGHGETTYQWAVAAGSDAPAWVDDAAHKTSELTKTVTGLAAGTYKFYVRSYCDSEDQSDAAVSASFTTATVPAPTIGTITTTNESAHATWTAPDVSYAVQYQWSTDGSSWSAATSNLYADISDLEANHSYTFYVRSYYDATRQSAAVSKAFKTACDPFTVAVGTPFEQNFNDVTTNAIPDCWNNDEGTTTTASYKWKVVTGGQSGKCAMFNGTDNGSGKTNVFATPLIELNSDADLTFYWKNKKTGAYNVEISVDGVSRTTLVGGLTGKDAWTLVDMPLTSYNGHTIQLFFCGTSANDGSANLYLDEFRIVPVSCRKPASDPVVNSKTATTAEISWTAGGDNADYQFSLVAAGEDPVWDAENVVSALNKTIEGLNPVTNYDFYVRTYCDSENQSDARKVSFKTDCADYVTLPFNENFDALAYQTIPECWNNDEGTSGDYYKWKAVMPISSTNYVQFNSSTNDADATNVLATPTILLGEGNLLSFKAMNPTGGDFKVQIEGEGIAREDLLTGLTGIADWTLKYVAIPAKFNNKKVQLFFCATSNAGDGNAYISLDDVRVTRGEVFSDDEDNASRFTALKATGETMDVIFNRTVLCNGDYNTLCLPFSLDADQLAESPLANFKLKAFDYASIVGDELQLAIAPASSIEAGIPYFAAYQGSIANQTVQLYQDVVITANTPGSKEDGDIAYQGVFNPVDLAAQSEGGGHNELFLASGNTIYWPAQAKVVKGFRAYFRVTVGGTALRVQKGMRARLVERPNAPTGMDNVQDNEVQSTKVLENNQVVIIRNGVKYSVQGQIIQ